jgi:hypothetical protein
MQAPHGNTLRAAEAMDSFIDRNADILPLAAAAGGRGRLKTSIAHLNDVSTGQDTARLSARGLTARLETQRHALVDDYMDPVRRRLPGGRPAVDVHDGSRRRRRRSRCDVQGTESSHRPGRCGDQAVAGHRGRGAPHHGRAQQPRSEGPEGERGSAPRVELGTQDSENRRGHGSSTWSTGGTGSPRRADHARSTLTHRRRCVNH